MTVSELIAQLQKLPGDLEVFVVEGTDEQGPDYKPVEEARAATRYCYHRPKWQTWVPREWWTFDKLRRKSKDERPAVVIY